MLTLCKRQYLHLCTFVYFVFVSVLFLSPCFVCVPPTACASPTPDARPHPVASLASPEERTPSIGSGGGTRPHTLPILETTPDSPQPMASAALSSLPSPNSDGSDAADGIGAARAASSNNLLQLSSPTASRRISSGSTLKHFGNIMQLTTASSFGEWGWRAAPDETEVSVLTWWGMYRVFFSVFPRGRQFGLNWRTVFDVDSVRIGVWCVVHSNTRNAIQKVLFMS